MRTIIAVFLLICVLGIGAAAQPISVGIRGGVPLTQAFADLTLGAGGAVQIFSQATGYAIGPMVELHLPLGFSVEADALYRPIDLGVVSVGPGAANASGESLTSWEFPVVAKYRFLHLPIVKPYVEAGPSFRHVGASYFSNTGFILGLGIEIKILRLRIEPDIRYNRWGGDAQSALLHLPTQVNQAEFLLGIAF